MSENTNIELTVEAWADIVIQNWHDKIDKLNINRTYDLYNSFIHHIITNANGNIARIEFSFNYYGKFVDMGVGSGVSLNDIGVSSRRPKRWYSPVMYREIKRLAEIMAEKFARKGALAIIENIDDNALKHVSKSL